MNNDNDPLTKGDFKRHEDADTMQFVEMHRKFDEFPPMIREAIKMGIKETVNGKIDKLTRELQEHMVRVEPAIKKFENGETVTNYFSSKIDLVIKASSVITAIGVIIGAAWLVMEKVH